MAVRGKYSALVVSPQSSKEDLNGIRRIPVLILVKSFIVL